MGGGAIALLFHNLFHEILPLRINGSRGKLETILLKLPSQIFPELITKLLHINLCLTCEIYLNKSRERQLS